MVSPLAAGGVVLAAGFAGSMIAGAITGCSSMGPIAMGNCGTTAEIRLSNEVITEKIISSVQESQQKIISETINTQVQEVRLNNYSSLFGCNELNINQEMNINIEDQTIVSTTMVSEMLKATATSIGSFIDQNQKQIKGALSDASDMDLIIEAKNKISDILNSSTIKKQVLESIKKIVNVQQQTIVINFANVPESVIKAAIENGSDKIGGGVCNINQNFFGVITISTVLNTVFNELNKDETLNEIRAKLDQKQDSENPGIIDTIAGFFKSAIFMWMIIIIAVIIGIVLFWYFLLKNPEGVKALGDSASGVMSTARSGKSPSSGSSTVSTTSSSTGSKV